MRATEWLAQPISGEFEGAKLGDSRRSDRLKWLAEKVMTSPGLGFPQAVDTASELEGVYRFLRNERVAAAEVLEPHLLATAERVRSEGVCIVAHDTTEVTLGGSSPRTGLGATSGGGQGFLAHVALAVLPGEDRLPLGVLGLHQHVRTRHKGGRRRHSSDRRKDPERESLRWPAMLEAVHSRCPDSQLIHVMDREADIFEVLAKAQELGSRYVIRSARDRGTEEVGVCLRAAISELEPQLSRTISVSSRPRSSRAHAAKEHPPRNARSAEVGVAGRRLTVVRPRNCKHPMAAIELNVVRVWELAPMEGEPPIEWVLLTTEPIDTTAELATVVDYYRSRWVIEDFFKALKQGCSLEKRQLESYQALSNALAVFLPIAWRLLLMRSLARVAPEQPATAILTEPQLLVIKFKLRLPAVPNTIGDALLAVARLGGHLKNNGMPGWQTLGKGYEKVLDYEIGFRAALASLGSDQS